MEWNGILSRIDVEPYTVKLESQVAFDVGNAAP